MHNRQSDHPLSVYANVEGWVRRTAELGFTGDGMEKVGKWTFTKGCLLTFVAERLDTYHRGRHYLDRTSDQHTALGTAARAIHAVLLMLRERKVDWICISANKTSSCMIKM
jgi:hypothetical protein